MVFVIVPIILIGIAILIPSTIKKPPQKSNIVVLLQNVPRGSMVRYKNNWSPIINLRKDTYGNVCEITIPYEFGLKLEQDRWVYIDSVIVPDKSPTKWEQAIMKHLKIKK